MQVTVDIPDEVAKQLPSAAVVSRQMLEAYAAQAYQEERLSRAQVGRLLGLDRWKTEQFLATRGALRLFTAADYELESRPQR